LFKPSHKLERQMKITDMVPKDSRFLKKEDVLGETPVTVRGFKKVNVGSESEPDEKVAIFFQEFEKPMILNTTNAQLLAMAVGDDSEAAKGKQVILWSDPTVSFGGKLVGGLRLKPMPLQGTKMHQPGSFEEDSIPFMRHEDGSIC